MLFCCILYGAVGRTFSQSYRHSRLTRHGLAVAIRIQSALLIVTFGTHPSSVHGWTYYAYPGRIRYGRYNTSPVISHSRLKGLETFERKLLQILRDYFLPRVESCIRHIPSIPIDTIGTKTFLPPKAPSKNYLQDCQLWTDHYCPVFSGQGYRKDLAESTFD